MVHRIRSCSETKLKRLSSLFGRAFFTDPLYEYIFPDLSTRQEAIAWELGNVVLYGLRFGAVHVDSRLQGCAVWLPPGETDFTEERMSQTGMLDSSEFLVADVEKRLTIFIERSEEVHRRIVPDPHWYLVLLGVEPDRQKNGIGSALLEYGLGIADEGRFPVYLETAEKKNLRFYCKHGFEVREQSALPGGPELWYMIRENKLGESHAGIHH